MRSAERHFRRSAETNPLDFKSQNRLARHLLAVGKLDEAREHMLESRRLAPDDPDVQNIWIEYAVRRGDYEDAIRRARVWMAVWEMQMRDSTVALVGESIALAYLGARRHDEALAQLRRLTSGDQEPCEALVAAHAGRRGEARAALARFEQRLAAGGVAPSPPASDRLAQTAILLGDFDLAFAHLDRLVAARSFPDWLNVPLFHAIRRDPRWPGFAARLDREFFANDTGAPPAAAGR
jgi:tetratricopeptide (TPR) repeat protein